MKSSGGRRKGEAFAGAKLFAGAAGVGSAHDYNQRKDINKPPTERESGTEQGRGKQELFALRAGTCEVCTGSMGMGYLEPRQEIGKLGHWRERWEKMLQKSYVQAPVMAALALFKVH